jgi:hypothetical protein
MQSINDPAHSDAIDRTANKLDDAFDDVVDKVSHEVGVGKRALVAFGNMLVRQGAAEGYTAAVDTIHRETALRVQAEDIRANHRNFNRMMTLFGALAIGLCVTFLLTNPQYLGLLGLSPAQVKPFVPYAFVITVFLDSAITAYSYIKHY